MNLRLAILEAALDVSDDAILSLDLDARITTWNHAAERVFGYGEDDIFGEPLTELFPEHLRADMAIVLANVTSGDRLDHFETEIQRKDGMPVPIALSAAPVHESEELIAVVLLARDITEQRLTQATLAEVEGRVRLAEAMAHVGGWLWDVRTGVVQWSDELHRIHGVDPLDFEGTFDAHVAPIHPEDRPRVQASLEACVVSGRAFDDEYRVLRPDGTLRWLHARAEPAIGSAGDVVGLRGVAQDVTSQLAGEV